VTRVLLRGRPYAGPGRAPVSADADQVEGLHALAGLRRWVVLEQDEGGPRICEPGRPSPTAGVDAGLLQPA
jgi:hypothetical protein